jgi:hypothetical protein
METVIQKYIGHANAHGLMKTIEHIQQEDFTVDDIPCVLSRLVLDVSKFKKITGPNKKKLVIGILSHIIELDDDMVKMIPHMIDGFALMVKAKKTCLRVCG